MLFFTSDTLQFLRIKAKVNRLFARQTLQTWHSFCAFRSFIALVFLCAIAGLIAGCGTTNHTSVFTGTIFGTSYRVVVYDADLVHNQRVQQKIQTELADRLQRLDALYSHWNKHSSLSRLNQASVKKWIVVPQQLLALLQRSFAMSRFTNGFFDPTLGHAINHWGFGPENSTKTPQLIGTDHILIDTNKQSVYKQQAVQINLSAIAKGHAVDDVSDWFTQQGYTNHLVEIGGEVRAQGTKGAQKWRVGLESPTERLTTAVHLANMALATSGDYRNFIEQDGKLLPHVLDPKTGAPVQHGLASVSVLYARCETADALATALMSMGLDKARAFARTHDLAAYFVQRTADGFSVHKSKRWEGLVLE